MYDVGASARWGVRLTAKEFDLMPEPAFAVAGDGSIAAWNRAARSLLGWRASAAKGMSCAALLEGRSRDGLECVAACPRLRQMLDIGRTLVNEPQPTLGSAMRLGPHPDMSISTIDGEPVDVKVIDRRAYIRDTPVVMHVMYPKRQMLGRRPTRPRVRRFTTV